LIYLSNSAIPPLREEAQKMGLREFTSSDGRVSVQGPGDWKTVAPLTKFACMAATSANGHVLLEMVVGDTPSTTSPGEPKVLLEIAAVHIEAMKEEHPRVRVIRNSEPYGAIAGTTLRLTLEHPEKTKHGILEMFTVNYFFIGRGNVFVSINFKALSAEYERVLPTIESVAQSVKIFVRAENGLGVVTGM
jgi:hypothetical protein